MAPPGERAVVNESASPVIDEQVLLGVLSSLIFCRLLIALFRPSPTTFKNGARR
jgi:hypothetical protein